MFKNVGSEGSNVTTFYRTTKAHAMHEVTLRAHFDGQQILLDEPYELEPETRLIVTILSENKVSYEREAWLNLSWEGLENAYSENDAEYTLDMIRRPNPYYKRR